MSRFCGRCDESIGEQVRPAYKTYFGRSEHYRSTRGELIKIGAKVVALGAAELYGAEFGGLK